MILGTLIRGAAIRREAMEKGRAALQERRRGLVPFAFPWLFWDAARLARGMVRETVQEVAGDEVDDLFEFRLPYVIPGFRVLNIGRRARLFRRGGKIHFSAQKRSLFFARRLSLSLVLE